MSRINCDLWKCSGVEKDPVYRDGEHGGSDLSVQLQNWFTAAEIEKLNGSQLDHLMRVLSDCLSRVKRIYWGRYFQIKRATQVPRFLWTEEEKKLGYHFCFSPHWWDHGETWRDKDSNKVYYVSHPYSLNASDFQQFTALEKAGYDVEITGRSHYFPGQTVCVRVSKKATA